MKGAKYLQTIGLIIAIPLMGYAVYCNQAEPEPPKITPTVTVEVNKAGEPNEIEIEVKKMEKEKYDDLGLLARCVEAEAGNQSLLGKRLVTDVVLNRVESPNYPDTVSEVIRQAGQFTVAGNGQIDRVDVSPETWAAVALEMAGRIDYEIIFFQTGGYSKYGEAWERVGDHYFSKKRKAE